MLALILHDRSGATTPCGAFHIPGRFPDSIHLPPQEAAAATRGARCAWAALHVLILSVLALWDSDLRAAARAGDGAYVGAFAALLTAEMALFATLSASDPGFCEPRPCAWRPPGAEPAPVRCQDCTVFAVVC